ncbi:MAG: DUF2520 domain-containing protein [Acidimicrobiaceae bacterium]|nr:DUF2520 domain-containing protein [Acidimicrobiaceae bacterium]
MNVTIIGAGRAGTSFHLALSRAGHVTRLIHHERAAALEDADLVMLCVPDDEIAVVAQAVPVRDEYVVAHVSGSRGLDALARHRRVASIHPLMTLPTGEIGSRRLVGATFCVSGDPLGAELVASLRGQTITIDDQQRTAYHAAAAVAANHLVALMGHVEQLARSAGLSLEVFLPLARQALEDVAEFGPQRALTGAASRGDMTTIDAHLAAIPESERPTYVAMANCAFELAERHRSQTHA